MKKISAPKAKRLPSGSWMCRVTAQGEDRCFTGSIKAEVEAQALEYKLTHQVRPLSARTVGDAVAQYIRGREKVLSPSTVRGYEQITRNYFRRLQALPLKTLSAQDCQAAIADELEAHSAKSVKNAWGLFSSAIKAAGSGDFPVRLPQIPEPDTPWLSPDQIPIFLEAIKGHKVEIPALLALHSLRRSEILDLTWDDLDLAHGRLHVSGAAVVGKDQQLVHKQTGKTASSTRWVSIWLPRLTYLLQTAPRSGDYVVDCHANTLYYWINKLCKQAGLPEVGVHGLRRSFASLAYHLGLPERVTMELGGWSDLATMHKSYVRIAEAEKEKAADAIRAWASSL